eukprot:3638901-Amphidinium_carterae.1
MESLSLNDEGNRKQTAVNCSGNGGSSPGFTFVDCVSGGSLMPLKCQTWPLRRCARALQGRPRDRLGSSATGWACAALCIRRTSGRPPDSPCSSATEW